MVGRSYEELVALESVTATLQNFAGQDYCRPGDIFWSNRFLPVIPARQDLLCLAGMTVADQNFAGCFCIWIFDMFYDS